MPGAFEPVTPGDLSDDFVFLLCDLQERFRTVMSNIDTVIRTTQYLTSVAKELKIPIIVTEQYSKALGPTIPECFANGELQEHRERGMVIEKKMFSMITSEMKEYIGKFPSNKRKFVLFGIEAHVCVQQTCLDLLELGYEVYVICDAVSSQQKYDRKVALRRMEKAGAVLTTAQSLAFMLLQTADHDSFKTVSKLTVNSMTSGQNEFN